jgi:hypothetical protein
MKPDIYEPAGWVNVPWIASRPTWLKVLIGARQVGKTYGVLKYHLDNDIPFLLMRRTTKELEAIANNPKFDPFNKFAPEYTCKLFKYGDSYNILDYDANGKPLPDSYRGSAISLPEIATVRGFDGSGFTSVILDEAVPEKIVRVLKAEGDAMLNAYTTISANRELEGRPPLTLWLLSNTNNINSPILSAFNLLDDIVAMQARGREYIETPGGVSIFFGRSEKIVAQRKETVLAKQISSDSKFARMAYGNEWSYDISPLIRQRSIKGMTPLCSYAKQLYLWEDDSSVYVCGARHKGERYADNDFERAQFVANNRWLVSWYAAGMVTFSDIKLLALFKRIFDIDY